MRVQWKWTAALAFAVASRAPAFCGQPRHCERSFPASLGRLRTAQAAQRTRAERGSRASRVSRAKAATASKVEAVEQYLARIGGSAKIRALKSALAGLDRDFLQKYFEVTSDDVVKSRKGHQRHERNIKEFLKSKGSAPLTLVMETFSVPRRWLASHEDFLVQGGRIRLRVRQTDQPEVEIVEDHVGVFQMRPSSERTAQEEIARLRVFLMSQVAHLPTSVQSNALRRLKGMWHPDAAPGHYLGHDAVIAEVFRFLCSVEVAATGLHIPPSPLASHGQRSAVCWVPKVMESFQEDFAECISRKDFRAATELCKQQLQKTPDSRYVWAQEQEDLEEELLGLEELADEAAVACDRAYEAMFAYLHDEERLWAVGEQAVGIFWDTGQLEPAGPRRDRLKSMAETLTRTLSSRLKLARAGGIDNEWLFEALGELWFFQELGLAVSGEPWLTEACTEGLRNLKGKVMEELAGFSLEGLKSASCGELCDTLMQVWTVERSSVCGLLNTPPLEYGVREVLAEVRRRPLILPPKPGFYHCFYLMTHVVYTLNCFNGHLPNRRSDCPWLYAYLECCLEFWMTVASAETSGMSAWQGEAVDAIAEAVDCLRGLNEICSQTTIRACRWLLSRQQADGFFVSPNSRRSDNEYDQLHPTWTAAAALQLQREAPGPSQLCACWARHAREAAAEVGFSQPPA
ncbi:unnamed protein product [Symbiodinium sp. KB8]|nr:unnamed protein product [Symbiodinium sp. KB8]